MIFFVSLQEKVGPMTLGFTTATIKALAPGPPPAPKITRHEDIEVVASKPKKAKKVKTTPAEGRAQTAPKAAKSMKRLVVKVHVKNKRLRSMLKLDKKPAA